MARKRLAVKSVRIADQIIANISKGIYPIGEMLPSEKQLGEDLRVSRMTVRRTVDSLADQGLLERIPHRGVVVRRGVGDAAQAAGSHPGYANGDTAVIRPVIAAVLSSQPDEGMVLIQDGIQDYAKEYDLDLQFVSPSKGNVDLAETFSDIERTGIDGVIILPYPGESQEGALADFEKRGFPAVCVEKRSNDIGLPSVDPDNASGMYRAVNYLIQTYKAPVHYLSMTPDHKADKERHMGYVRAMNDAGYHDELEQYEHFHMMKSSDPEYWSPNSPWLRGYELASGLLARTPLPMSIACVKDYFAWGVYKAAEEQGLKIGEDVMVVGFDDLTIAQLLNPGLTTVRQSFREKGYVAARLLHQQLTGVLGKVSSVCLPVDLVKRGSA